MKNVKVVLIKKDAYIVSASSPHMEGHFSTYKDVEPRKLAEAFLLMFAPPNSNPQIVSDDGLGIAFYFTQLETPNDIS